MKYSNGMLHHLSLFATMLLVPAMAAVAQSSDWTDPADDVTSSHADIIGGSARVVDNVVELRVQLSDSPFPLIHTHNIDWCIDADQNPMTGAHCGSGDLIGADVGISIHYIMPGANPDYPDGRLVVAVGQQELNTADVYTLDTATNTVTLRIPLHYIDDDGNFNYVVSSVFGGSLGANDFAPDNANFKTSGSYFSTDEIDTVDNAALGLEWWDAVHDVASSYADILAGTARVADGTVELRVRLKDTPFPATHIHHIGWCIDTDQNPATGSSCGSGDLIGADQDVSLDYIVPGQIEAYPEGKMVVRVGQRMLDADDVYMLDTATNVITLRIPLKYIDNDGAFNYIVESSYGNSAGEIDYAPSDPGFKWPLSYFTSHVVYTDVTDLDWTDTVGDVKSNHADIIGGSAHVKDDIVELRVRLNDFPFPLIHTHNIGWCIDADQNAATGGSCGYGDLTGADVGISVWYLMPGANVDYPDGGIIVETGQQKFTTADVYSLDAATNTVVLRIPLKFLDDDGNFNYIVTSVFGGSFKINDFAPDNASFGAPGTFFTSRVLKDESSGVDTRATAGLSLNSIELRVGDETLTATYTLPASCDVHSRIVNSLGEEVAALNTGWQGVGTHVAQLNVASLPSGIYFYELNAGDQRVVRRVVVAR